MDLTTLLSRHARCRPDQTALVIGPLRLTFGELNARVNRLCHVLLDLGLACGDPIAILLPNSLQLLELYWAAAKLGLVAVPLSTLLRGSALENLIRDSGARAVVSTADLVPGLEDVRAAPGAIGSERWLLAGPGTAEGYRSLDFLMDRAPDREPPMPALLGDEPYNVIYSSGTTGTPKGIVISHRVRGIYATLFAAVFRIGPESVVMHAGSLVFNGAFVTLMPALAMGSRYVLESGFDADRVLDTIERERVTHAMMVPSQIVALMQSPRWETAALDSLRMICNVGAPLHRHHKDAFARRLPRVFHELYGLTEGFVTILDRDDLERKPDSVGTPPPFFEMRILDDAGHEVPAGIVGEITGRGPLLMSGYLGRPDLTALAVRDGWLHSGDLGFVDREGFLHLVDRKKDLILSGGVNVYPRDIEEVVVRHAAVREAAVFGVPDDKWGETPVAAIILHSTGSITADALRAWINERVGARYQQVREVVFYEEFPRSSAGKTLKRVMRDHFPNRRTES